MIAPWADLGGRWWRESSTRPRHLRQVALAMAMCSVMRPSYAAEAQRPADRPMEFRVDAISSRAATIQLGGGVSVPAGIYARMGVVAAGGIAVRHDSVRAAARFDGSIRFLLDPLREYPIGLYGIGGVSLMYDAFERWRPLVVLGVGAETRSRHGRTTAVELALGGGVRVGVVLRRATVTRR